MADEHKAKGNAAFSAGDFEEAIKHFSAGIAVDAGNHVLYSNRSAARASLKQYQEALEDAQRVVELKPEWPKGFSRLGAANVGLTQWDDAISAYKKGLQLEPGNAGTKQALEDAIAARAAARSAGGGGNPAAGLFGPEFLSRLAMDGRTRGLLQDPEFQGMLQAVQADPMGSMTKFLGNDKFQQALSVGLGMNIMSGDQAAERGFGADGGGADEEMREEPAAAPKPAAQPKPPPQPQPEPEPLDLEAAAAAERRAEALKAKEAGNAAYKARRFPEAVGHYDRAIELDATDISFLTNRAAVHFEAGDFDACIGDCDAAVARGRELRQDFKLIAKALTRKGNALVRQGQLEAAVEAYHKALTEHRNPDTLKRLNDTEKRLREAREQAYIDLDACDREREAGNQAFKEQRYPEAVAHYSEALKRGPPAVNPEAYKLFSNRAACFTKLGAYPDGLKDAEQCISLKPDFAKGYSRKGHLQFFMKDFDEAMTTYQEGLDKADPHSEELRNGLAGCLQAINKMRTGQASDEEVKARQARAMQDPEVQRILTDPVMRQVMEDLQSDPKNSQHHLQHPQIRANIDKLVTAGLVQMR